MKSFKLIMSVAFVFLSFALSHAAEPIKIGAYFPLTGQNAFGGQLELEGVKLANSLQPTVLNRPVEIIVVDNKSDKVEAANAVVRLIEKDNVNAIIGTYSSSLALAGGEVAEQAGIPVVATSATNPLVTIGKDYNFRACFIDPYQGSAAANYAYKNRGFKKVAVLTDIASDYGVGLTSFFKRAYTKLGGEIVAEQRYNSGDQDFTAQLTDIISKKPDMLFIPAYFAEGAIIMKQARELGAKFVIMGADAMDNPETIKIAGDAGNGFLHTTFPYDISMKEMNKEAKEFTEAWKKMYPNKAPNVNAALGYNAYFLILDAIKRANSSDPEDITNALAETKDLPTVLGLVSINETHDAEMPVGIIEYLDGKRKYLGSVEVN